MTVMQKVLERQIAEWRAFARGRRSRAHVEEPRGT
jgi:hypothetical protein